MKLLITCLALTFPAITRADTMEFKKTPLTADAEPMQTGAFEPTWASLQKYEVPDWFRDAKFGIWAHWGPQCEPEAGDWYARAMYEEGSRDYKSHLANYGHPSEQGFKDILPLWTAEHWDPEVLVAFYKKCGAKYFFALANHHDNFDLWNSRHHAWNAVNIGPKKDLIAGWAKAAHDNGLRFGVSVHAAHAWNWYEVAQGADKTGAKAGVPYDGKLTKADGVGKWWEGYDPQELYAQSHKPSPSTDTGKNWDWTNPDMTLPDDAYCQNIYDRTIDLINQTHPDMVYFDDTVLPLYPVSDIGLKIAAHFYNASALWHHGVNEAVISGKILNAEQKKAMIWDVERGASDKLEALPWQTCTCIGNWHYDRSIFERHAYKSASTAVHTLADVVSKNGNLLLSVPVRADGTIDEDEHKIVEQIGAWMAINGEAIYATRPWKVFGEGPAMEAAAKITAQGFNEGKGKPFTAEDIRFTKKGNAVYAIVMGKPAGAIKIKSLGRDAKLFDGEIKTVTQLGSQAAVKWHENADGLVIETTTIDGDIAAAAFRIE